MIFTMYLVMIILLSLVFLLIDFSIRKSNQTKIDLDQENSTKFIHHVSCSKKSLFHQSTFSFGDK